MGVIIRQTFKSSIAIYIGIFVGVLNRLFLYPFALTETEIGLISIIINVSIFISQVGLLGGTATLTKYYSYFNKSKKTEQFLSLITTQAFLGISLLIILFTLFYSSIIEFIDDKKNSLLMSYGILIIPLSLFLITSSIATTISSNMKRITFPSITNSLLIKILISLGLIMVNFSILSFSSFFNYLTLSYGITAILIILYLKKYLKVKLNFNLKKISLSELNQIANYSFFALISSISTYVTLNIDSLMITRYKDLGAAGIYSIAFFMGTVIEIPKRSISNISAPIIADYWDKKQHNNILALYKKTSINQGIIAILLFLLLLTSINEIFYLLPNQDIYIQGKNVAIFIGLSKVIDMISGSNAEILRTSNRYRWDFFIMIFFIGIIIITNLILIPLFDISGAALATLTSVFLYNLIRFYLLKRFFNFTPFDKHTIHLVLIAIFFIGVNSIIPETKLTGSTSIFTIISIITIKSLALSTLYLILIYYLNISPEVSNLLKKSFNFFKKKIN